MSDSTVGTAERRHGVKEIPELVGEFAEMAQAYLRQETLEPAKRLGKFAGFSIGAGILWSVSALLLGIAALRLVIEVLPGDPTHQMWSALGYVLTSIALLAVTVLVVWGASR